MIDKLKKIRREHRLSQTAMAEMLGLSLRGYQYIEKGDRKLDLQFLELVAKKLNIPVSRFFEEMKERQVSRVRVLGEVQAGVWREAMQWDDEVAVDVPYSGKHDYPEIYGLRVVGDSMDLVYPEGTVVITVPIWEYTSDLTSGRRVIVERTRNDGIVEATAKELEIKDGLARLWPRSTNPRFQQPIDISWPYKTPQELGIETVEIKGVIVGSYRPED